MLLIWKKTKVNSGQEHAKDQGDITETTNRSFLFFVRKWENTFINAGSTREKINKSCYISCQLLGIFALRLQ